MHLKTLLVSKVLKIFKLIWLAPATNAVSERLCSTLHRVKIYLLQSIFKIIYDLCLSLATYKEIVD